MYDLLVINFFTTPYAGAFTNTYKRNNQVPSQDDLQICCLSFVVSHYSKWRCRHCPIQGLQGLFLFRLRGKEMCYMLTVNVPHKHIHQCIHPYSSASVTLMKLSDFLFFGAKVILSSTIVSGIEVTFFTGTDGNILKH